MIAYHGKQAVKDKYVKRMQDHMAADELIAGIGWEPTIRSGCAVGCTFDKYSHGAGPMEIGVPSLLLHVEDVLFEALFDNDCPEYRQFPLAFLEAIQPGADLLLVWPAFVLWLAAGEDSPARLGMQDAAVKAEIDAAIPLLRTWAENGIAPLDSTVGEVVQPLVEVVEAFTDREFADDATEDDLNKKAEYAARGIRRAFSHDEGHAAQIITSIAYSAMYTASGGSQMGAVLMAALVAMQDKLLALLAAAPMGVAEYWQEARDGR